MTLPQFLNCLKILRSIDGWELPHGWGDPERFLRDPYETFLRLDPESQAAIWKIIERRSLPRGRPPINVVTGEPGPEAQF